MAADAAGSVTTVGRSSELLRLFCREDLGFDSFQFSCTYDDLITESQPERAAANLGAPLLKLQKGQFPGRPRGTLWQLPDPQQQSWFCMP